MKASESEVEAGCPPCQEGEVAERLANHVSSSDHDIVIDVDIAKRLLRVIAGLPCVGYHSSSEDVDRYEYSNAGQNGGGNEIRPNERPSNVESCRWNAKGLVGKQKHLL